MSIETETGYTLREYVPPEEGAITASADALAQENVLTALPALDSSVLISAYDTALAESSNP